MAPASPTVQYFDFSGLRLSYLKADPGPVRRGTVLICHANGFSAGTYQYYLRRLCNDYRVLALDFAGHGNSEATLAFQNWNFFRDQIIALLEHEGLADRAASGPLTGIGHSLGGACLFRAEALRPGLFSRLIGLDPVLLSWPRVIAFKLFGNPLTRGARQRRFEFGSRKLIERAFRSFALFADWDPETFGDFAATCFHDKPDGRGVELACPREVEARIFSQSDFASLFAYPRVQTPSHIILPDPYQVCPPGTARKITRNHPDSSFELWPGAKHLFPFEQPARTLERISELLG